jgi:hypothetical protein
MPEAGQPSAVARDSVVVEVAAQFLAQHAMLLGNR